MPWQKWKQFFKMNSIGDWDVSSVEEMSHMFQFAEEFDQDIGDWDILSVTDMNYMFYGSNAFNQEIGKWDVSSVNNMKGMFDIADNFNQNLGDWVCFSKCKGTIFKNCDVRKVQII